jgi:diguanylate cyclase (GGDEF)-like protein/PAS domain S-box-containing protein
MPGGGRVSVRTDITELKRREVSFRLLFDENPVPMCVYDHRTLRFLAVNQALIDHHGYSREQFLSMSIHDITPREEREAASAAIATLSRDISHSGRTWRHIRADGSEILIAAYSREIDYENHNARLNAIIDVTERTRAEQQMQATRAFLEQVIDNVPLSITVKDAEHLRIVMMNRTAEEYWGVPREEAIGKTVAEVFGEEMARDVVERDKAALKADGPIYLGEHRKVGRGDRDRMFASRRVAVRDAQGKPIYVLGVMEDVTERRRAEDDLRRTRAFLDTVIENVPAMLFVKEPEQLRYMLMNRAGEKLLGVCRDQIIGKNDHDLLPATDADIAAARDRELLRSGQQPDIVHEEPIHTPHNGTRLVSTKRIVVLDQDSRAQYLLGVAEDITERKLAEGRIEHLARFDSLTELPNRAAFTTRLAEAIQASEGSGNSFALLFLDLDRFKEVNDVFGHGVGDALLQEVTGRLKQAAGDAFVARLGGDEFTLIVEGPQPASASAVAERILSLISDDIQIGERRVRAGVSVGVALFPNDARDASMLLANADAALYRAKDRRGAPSASSKRKWTCSSGNAGPCSRICKRRWRRAKCPCTTSRRFASTAKSPASKRSPDGTIPSGARSRPEHSSRWPRKAAPSSRWANGCCTKPVARPLRGKIRCGSRSIYRPCNSAAGTCRNWSTSRCSRAGCRHTGSSLK